MKKLLLILMAMAVVTLAGCHRVRVKHDHSKQMLSVRPAKDSLQKNDVEEMDGSWQDDDLISIPDAPEDAKAEAHPEVEEEIEKILRGEE